MKYIPLNTFPEHDDNPFVENAIREIKEHKASRKVFIKGDRSLINQVVNDNGEIIAHSAFLKTKIVDDEQFVKVYLSKFKSFYDLKKNAIKVFGYIINKCIIPDRDTFYFDYDEAREYTGYTANNHIRTGLSSLIEQGIIARSTNPYKFFINPLVIFNGDRITFAESYVRRKTKQLEYDGQLPLWP